MENQTNSNPVDISTLDREALARMVAELQGERDYLLECQTDKRRLTRLLDEAISGEGNAAQQASLCDLVEQARRLREERDDLQASLAWLVNAVIENHEIVATPDKEAWLSRAKECGKNWRRNLAEMQESAATWRERAELAEAQLAAARTEAERLKSADNPEYDATDGASPAWWRGHDHTTKVFCALVNDILDGKDDGSGANREPWASTRKRLLGLRAEKSKWQRRAKLFHEAYKDKDFESFALGLQKMQLEAAGADVILPRQNRSLRAKLFEACRERNRLRAALAQVGDAVKEVGAIYWGSADMDTEASQVIIWCNSKAKAKTLTEIVKQLKADSTASDLAAIVAASAEKGKVDDE
jgi:hypothetical protein